MWRNWLPNISIPTFDYLQSILALWMEDNRQEAIPLALIIIGETKKDAGKEEMLPLMERVTSVVNCEIEFRSKLDAYKAYMVYFSVKINDNSARLQPLDKEAEALLKESTRQGHSIITFHVNEGFRTKYLCPSSHYPPKNVFAGGLLSLRMLKGSKI